MPLPKNYSFKTFLRKRAPQAITSKKIGMILKLNNIKFQEHLSFIFIQII